MSSASVPCVLFFSLCSTSQNRQPTAEEIEEYCRDEDSSGCDLDMLEKLKGNLGSTQKKNHREERVRWSKAIDAAVAKCD